MSFKLCMRPLRLRHHCPASTAPASALFSTSTALPRPVAQDLLDLEAAPRQHSSRTSSDRASRDAPLRTPNDQFSRRAERFAATTGQLTPRNNPFTSLNSLSSSSSSSPSRRSTSSPSGNAALADIMNSSQFKANIRAIGQSTEDKARDSKVQADLGRQWNRRWRSGDVYAPHDVSAVEMEKWRKPTRPTMDILDVVDLSPVDNYKNFALISEFMTPMGRIKHSNETGLRPVNQRKIAKAIRRAIGMGLHPSVHKHPMILLEQSSPVSMQRMPRAAWQPAAVALR